MLLALTFCRKMPDLPSVFLNIFCTFVAQLQLAQARKLIFLLFKLTEQSSCHQLQDPCRILVEVFKWRRNFYGCFRACIATWIVNFITEKLDYVPGWFIQKFDSKNWFISLLHINKPRFKNFVICFFIVAIQMVMQDSIMFNLLTLLSTLFSQGLQGRSYSRGNKSVAVHYPHKENLLD